jgi:hypothetical protein
MHPQVEELCDDSCSLARNGVCDDGRNWARHQQHGFDQVRCDLGTDCGDCGPWKLHGPRCDGCGMWDWLCSSMLRQ